MNKLLAAWNVFRKGQVVANPTEWTYVDGQFVPPVSA